jgi:TadE-like protein
MTDRARRSQRSQGMTEFALIAPVLLLLIFAVVDFGRGLYIYTTLQAAANEGARTAVRASYYIDPSGTRHQWPTDADVANSVQAHAAAMNLPVNACPNGLLPNGGNPQGSALLPAPNQGWIFITDPSPDGSGVPNGPRGGLGTLPAPVGGCRAITPAVGNEPIKVTLWYNFQPITPIIQQVVGNRIIISAFAVYRAEYSN